MYGGNAAEPDVVDPSPGLGDGGEQSVPAFRRHRRAHLQRPTPCGLCLDDIAVMGQAVEQRSGHSGVAEDVRPFAKGEVGGDDD
jgi:hypothetical protein